MPVWRPGTARWSVAWRIERSRPATVPSSEIVVTSKIWASASASLFAASRTASIAELLADINLLL